MTITQGEGGGDHVTREWAPVHLAPEPAKAPTEQKVTAASRGAGIGGAVAALIVWALGRWAFGGDVPGEVSTVVILGVPMLGAYIDGWRAPHTPRPTPTQET